MGEIQDDYLMGLGPHGTSLLKRLGLPLVLDAGGDPAWVERDQERRTSMRLAAQIARSKKPGGTKKPDTKRKRKGTK